MFFIVVLVILLFKEATVVGISSYYFWGFAIGVDSIFQEVAGFSPLWFSQGKNLCLLSLMIIAMHVIILDKTLDHID